MTDNPAAATVTVLYFARLSEELGLRQETLTLPGDVSSVGELRGWLIKRGSQWEALADANLRVAVNQGVVKQDAPIASGDEVAFFPPVTGG